MKCPICSQICHPFTDKKHHIQYYHCGVCRFIFKSPDHYEGYDKQKERYDLHQNEEKSEGYQAYFKRFMDYILPLTGTPQHALDFGCGVTSLLAKMMAEEGIDCDYYDPIYHPESSYQDKTYDLIVSVEVFEHLHHPKELFEHLLSRLNRGGYLAIQTQFHYNSIEQFLNWHYRLDPTHIVFFTPETFRYLADLYDCDYRGDNGKNMLVIQKR
ncbi:MAG: class I SAM-dependent methyltransferase [Campylobacterota bacterium]|nr:class I SAM-dependent methyltransferase [Campylobacterota bacterium]